MIQRIVNNFYLRNLFILLVFISPDLLQDLVIPGRLNVTYIFNDIGSLVIFFCFFVFHNRILYEKLLRRKKYIFYTLSLTISLFICRELSSYLFWIISRPPGETEYVIRELKMYGLVFWMFVYWADMVYVFMAFGIYLAFSNFKEKERLLHIEHEKKELELKHLKAQFNPHFIFNALNNIYSHSLKKNNNTSELLLKLSDLIRFIVINAKKDGVSLDEEILFIENYLAFEKERLGKRCSINFSKSVLHHHQIAPFVFFTFIENAFKHGTRSMQHSSVDISLSTSTGGLHFRVENSIYKSHSGSSTGIGIANATKQLDMLYPGRHSLIISESDGQYIVTLDIKTSVHEMSYSR